MSASWVSHPSIWFVCKYCRRAFQEPYNLIKHKKEYHTRRRKKVTNDAGAKNLMLETGGEGSHEINGTVTTDLPGRQYREDEVSVKTMSTSKHDEVVLERGESGKSSPSNISKTAVLQPLSNARENVKMLEPAVQQNEDVNISLCDNKDETNDCHKPIISSKDHLPHCFSVLERVEVEKPNGARTKLKLKVTKLTECRTNSTILRNYRRTHVPQRNCWSDVPKWMLPSGNTESIVTSLITREHIHKLHAKKRLESTIYRQLEKHRNSQLSKDAKLSISRSQTSKPSRHGSPQLPRHHRSPIEILNSNQAKISSRSLVLETLAPASLDFDFVEDRLYYYVSKPKARINFFDVLPGLRNDTRVNLCRESPTISTKIVVEDMDLFYVESVSPECDTQSLHTMLVTIPSSQDRLVLYDTETGSKVEEFILCTGIIYQSLNCYSNGRIIVQSSSRPIVGTWVELLILSYPPLKLEARIQVREAALTKEDIRLVDCNAEFLTLVGRTGRIHLCDFDKLLEDSRTSEEIEKPSRTRVTHVVQEFSGLMLSAWGEYLLFGMPGVPAFYLIRRKSSYSVMQFSKGDSIPVGNPDLLQMESEDPKDINPYFMRNTNRLVLVGRSKIRIFDIVQTGEINCDGRYLPQFSLTVLFEKDFERDPPDSHNFERPAQSENYLASCGGRPLRNRAVRHLSLGPDDEFSLCYDDNYFLQQFVVVRVRVGHVTAFIYDSRTFKLAYVAYTDDCLLEFSRARGSEDMWQAELTCRFAQEFIAVKYSNRGNEKKHRRILYVLNLIKTNDFY